MSIILVFSLLIASGCTDSDNGAESNRPEYVTGDEVGDTSGKNDATTDGNGEGTVGDTTDSSGEGAIPDNTDENPTEDEENNTVTTNDLVIPLSELTTNAGFFGIVVDGTYIEVIAFRVGTDDYRTVFNTCQVCYSSGRGYYTQSGSNLRCANCGNTYALSRVGLATSVTGGCSPYPIFNSQRTVTDDAIILSYDFLLGCRNIFRSWR